MTLTVEGVDKSYSRRKALENVSLTLESGEITGLLGANGAGKSTLIKILAGYFFPTRGSVILGDISLSDKPEEYRRSIGYLPEGAPLATGETPDGLLAARFRLFHGANPSRELLDEFAERYGLGGDERHRPIKTLSRGYRQRTGLALAGITDPVLLLLDEPFSGLDPALVRKQRHILREGSKERIILFSSHILQEVYALCDSLVILHKGRVRALVRTAEYGRWEELDEYYSGLLEDGEKHE